MAKVIDIDDENFRRLWESLSEKKRVQALRNGYRAAARRFRDEAVRNLRTKLPKSNAELEKGIRVLAFKTKPGFRITVGTGSRKRKAGFYLNKQNQKKEEVRKGNGRYLPVLMWAEDGTKQRARRYHFRMRYADTGSLKPLRFMEETRDSMGDRINDDIKDLLLSSIGRAVRRYGGKTDK